MGSYLGQQTGQTAGGPWGGLPAAPQPWGGGQQWQAAQQSPWRLSPWQTQGMPSGVAPQQQPLQTGGMLSQGVSGDIPGFNPLQSGGGMHPPVNLGNFQPQQQRSPFPQQPQRSPMPSIMSPRTFSALSGDDTDYGTYLGNTLASAQHRFAGQRNRNRDFAYPSGAY